MTQRIALVTGGSRGLGKNAALKLADKGTDILFTYHSQQQAARDVVAEIEQKGRKAAAIQLNVGDSASFAAFASEVKTQLQTHWNRETFDYLVNNAGIGLYAPYADTSEEMFDELMRIHFKGPFFLTQHLLPLINEPGYAAYASMKGAMEVLTRYQAKELGARGISVNAIAPGAIETDFGGGHLRDNKELNAYVASQTALGRAGLPDDIGDAIAALLSDELAWMTAQRIEVSGGMFL